jgi:hypothetical protein
VFSSLWKSVPILTLLALIIDRSQQHPIVLTDDNLTNKHHATTETLLNKSTMQCFTAAGIIFLKLTQSLARRLGKDIEHPVAEKPLPGESSVSAQARSMRQSSLKWVVSATFGLTKHDIIWKLLSHRFDDLLETYEVGLLARLDLGG